jgi:hypothetical protein
MSDSSSPTSIVPSSIIVSSASHAALCPASYMNVLLPSSDPLAALASSSSSAYLLPADSGAGGHPLYFASPHCYNYATTDGDPNTSYLISSSNHLNAQL